MSRRPSSFGSACPTCFWMEECSCWNHLSIYHLESRHPAWISLKMFQVFAHSSTNTMSVGSAKDKLEVKLWVLCNSHFNDRNLDDGIRHQATVLVIGGVCGTLATKSPTTVGEQRFYIKNIHTYLTSIFYYINVCHIKVPMPDKGMPHKSMPHKCMPHKCMHYTPCLNSAPSVNM